MYCEIRDFRRLLNYFYFLRKDVHFLGSTAAQAQDEFETGDQSAQIDREEEDGTRDEGQNRNRGLHLP